MSRFGRRTFLDLVGRVAAGAVGSASTWPLVTPDSAEAAQRPPLGEAGALAGAPGLLRAGGLTVNGTGRPRGRRPRRLLVRLDSAGGRPLGRADRLPHRGPPDRPGPRRDRVGQRPRWSRPGRPSSPTRVRPWPPTPPTGGPSRPRGHAERWGPVSAPARFTTALRDGRLAGPVAASRRRLPAARPRHLPAHRGHAAGRHRRPRHRLRLRRAHLPAVRRRRAGGRLAQLLLPRRAVRAGRGLDRRRCPAERRSAIGVLHRWYGAGKGGPRSAPGLLVPALALVRRRPPCRVRVRRDLARAPGRVAALAAAQPRRRRLRRMGGRAGAARAGGRARVTTTARGPPSPSIGPAGTAPFTRTYAQRTTIAEHTVRPVTVHTLAGGVRRGRTSAPSTRPGHGSTFASGQAGRTVAMRVGYLLDPDGQVSTLHGTQETNLSFSYIMREGPQTFEAFTLLRLPLPARSTTPARPSGRDQVVALARHAAMPDVPVATFSSDDRMLDAVWRLNARSCLYCSHEQFVDTPTREKGQFLWDAANESEAVMRAYGEQNLSWQGLRDVARGQARYWPDGRVNAVYPNGDGARDYATFTARYPEWVWRYYVSTGRPRPRRCACYPSAAQGGRLAVGQRARPARGCSTGWATPATATRSTATTSRVAADTASNVLAVNAFNRVAQLADLAGDAAGAAHPAGAGGPADRGGQRHAASARRRLRRRRRRRRGPERARLAGGQRAGRWPTASCRRPTWPRSAPTWRASGIDVGPNHGLELLRGPGRGGPARGHGADPDRRLHPGLGPHPGQGRDLHLGRSGRRAT